MSPADMQQKFGNSGAAQALVGGALDQGGGPSATAEPEVAADEGAEQGAEEEGAVAAEAVALSPFEATAPARKGVTKRAKKSMAHPEPSEPVDSAQAAAVDAEQNQTRGAAAATVTKIDAVPEGEVAPAEQASFEDQLRSALHAAIPIPENEDDANRLIKEGGGEASAELTGQVDQISDKAATPLTNASADVPPGDIPPDPETDLVPEEIGAAPAAVSADSVVPPPIPDSQLDYSDHSASTDQVMTDNEITEEQLATGNEPEFNATLGARQEAESHAEVGAAELRESEAATRADAQGRASQSIQGGLNGFHATRTDEVGAVVGTQGATKSKDEAERLRITNRVVAIKDKTQEDVQKILTDMKSEATEIFKNGLGRAEKAYERYFEDNKGGFLGFFQDLDKAFKAGRGAYEREVDKAVDLVVAHVERKLAEAKKRVETGKKDVDEFVAGLDESLQQFGEEAKESVAGDFETLEADIEASKGALVDSLVTQYKESQERVSAMEERLRLENMSIWDRIYEATVGLVQKILEFKNLLLSVLAGAMEIVGAIIADPIGFLGSLIDGVMGGLNRFKDNIAEHMKQGLMGWLFGALSSAGIELPTSFDIQGIFQLVFSVLGVTYQYIRTKAVRLLGEETVGRLEQVAEIFMVLVNEGPGGLWRMFMESIGDVKEMILGEIQNFVIENVIKAGITWLISLLNPVSAFFKACKAIYDIVMFFIERGQQIMELVNTIIESISAIVAGNVSAMSEAIEKVLGRILPVAISFLASLLGLGGISDAIKDIIKKIQKKVEAAIDWVVAKAVQLAKKVGGLFGGGKTDDTGQGPKHNDPEKQLKITAALADLHREEAKRKDEGVTQEEAENIASKVKRDNPVIKSIRVVDGEGIWLYRYSASPEETEPGGEKATILQPPDWVDEVGAYWIPNDPPTIEFSINDDHKSRGLSGEYADQLQAQEDGLNDLTMDQWRANRDSFKKSRSSESSKRKYEKPARKARAAARSDEVYARAVKIFSTEVLNDHPNLHSMPEKQQDKLFSAAKSKAKSQIKSELKGQHALHGPDAIAGGDISNITGFGSGAINSSIGSSWTDSERVGKLDRWAQPKIDVLEGLDAGDSVSKTKMNVRLILKNP